MSFGLYLFGFLILLGGLVYSATLMHVPSHWIVAMVLVLVGLGIAKGVKATRPKDSV
jgi:cadmium resistance protein CadD (predicted permease)